MHADSWIVGELRNWANWARTRPHYAHCYSIEHLYRSPQHWNPPEPRIVIDIPAALAVERCMRLIPARNRLALACHFIRGLPTRTCCQIIPMRFDLWEGFLAKSAAMIQNNLTIQSSANNLPLRNSRKPMLPVEKTAPSWGAAPVREM